MTQRPVAGKFGIGQPVTRVEDPKFLMGRGRFVDDLTMAFQAYGVVVVSPHAHARLRSVDTRAAKAAPGVLAVLTGADAVTEGIGTVPPLFMPEDMGGPKGYRTFRPVLASDKARYVGDRIVFVVAETLAQARDAAELVEIDYETLPAVIDPSDAVKDDAPRVWDAAANNVAFPLMLGSKDATDAAFARAAHVVTLKLSNNRLSANAMEPRGAIGLYDQSDETYTLYTSTQNPHGIRQQLAQAVFKVPETKVRVIAPDVGGGFGMKADYYPEEGLVLWAARKLGRPVKWIPTRSESMLGDDHSRDQLIEGELALDAAGKFIGLRARALNGIGAFVANAGVVPVMYTLKNLSGVYAIPAMHVAARAIFTNAAIAAPYRGAGRPEAAYLLERLVEKAARVMGIDSLDLRRRNYIRPEQLPYTTPTGFTYDSGEFARLTDRCVEMGDAPGYAARKAATERAGRLRGRSLIYYIEDTGVFNDRMELRFDPSGTVTILAGTFSHGQGHATTFAQLVSDWLGVPFETIRYVQGDTDAVSFGRGTVASRSATIGSGALREACDIVIDKARGLAGHLMEAAPADLTFEAGRFTIAGTDRSMSLVDVAKAFYRPAGLPKQFGVGLEAIGAFAADPPNFPNGAHLCELEIDPDTGEVRFDRYIVVDDIGRVINPLLADGQIHGALAQGIGQALMEHVIHDRESGQLLTGSFLDYTMPRADDFCDFELEFVEVLCKTNPLGVKGAGEAGTVGAPPAVINAILDALGPLGVEHIDMPATPARVWAAIQQARTAKAA